MENQKNDTLSILKSSFLFCGLHPTQLEILAQNTKLHTYRAYQTLIEEGIINDKIILILQGIVKIYKITSSGKEIFIGVEKSGDYLGVMDLDEKSSTATIETLQPTTVLILHKKTLLRVLEQTPILWKRMYEIVLAKLRELNQLHSIILGNDLYQRTHLLLTFLAGYSHDHTVLLSQETIASIVGATRPRVTETLHVLQKHKKITISPKKITVLS